MASLHRQLRRHSEANASQQGKAWPWNRYRRGNGGEENVGTKRCLCKKASLCSYDALQQASRFRAEAVGEKQHSSAHNNVEAFACGKPPSSASERQLKRSRKRNSPWDCDSALYDSFELHTFSNQLGRCLAVDPEAHLPSASHLFGSPLHKSGCLPTLSIPRSLRVASYFPFKKASTAKDYHPSVLQRRQKRSASIRKAFQKLEKTVAGAKAYLTFDCNSRGSLTCDQSRHEHKHEYQHLHHHYHHHLHHYSLTSNEEAQMAAAKLLRHFQADAACLSPHTLAELRKEIDSRQRVGDKDDRSLDLLM